MNIFLRISLVLLFVFTMAPAMQGQTVVIVNESVPASSMSVKELLDVYTLNKGHWSDGSRVTVFDLKSGKSKESFYSYIEMSEEDLQRIWLRKQFTGKARPPRSMSNEEEVVEMVDKTPGAIGYVSERAAAGRKHVRIIARIK